MDVTDIIDYNVSILNVNDLSNAFFCLARDNPTVGFPYDATRLTGHLYPRTAAENLGKLQTAYMMWRSRDILDPWDAAYKADALLVETHRGC